MCTKNSRWRPRLTTTFAGLVPKAKIQPRGRGALKSQSLIYLSGTFLCRPLQTKWDFKEL